MSLYSKSEYERELERMITMTQNGPSGLLSSAIMKEPYSATVPNVPHKSWYQRVLQNIILNERDPATIPELEIVCEVTRIGGKDIVVVAARNKSGEMHTFADDVPDFPSPQLLNKMRLFK